MQFLCGLQLIIISLAGFLEVGLNMDVLILKAQAEASISQVQISFPLTMAVEGSKSSVSVSQYYEITSSTMNEL